MSHFSLLHWPAFVDHAQNLLAAAQKARWAKVKAGEKKAA